MNKTTIPFMLALLASAHLMQAAGQSFTATIKPSDDLATIFPGLEMIIFNGGTASIPINNSGPTQVTLTDGTDYNTIMACKNSCSVFADSGGQGTLLNYKFRANQKTPIIVINATTGSGGGTTLSVSFKKS